MVSVKLILMSLLYRVLWNTDPLNHIGLMVPILFYYVGRALATKWCEHQQNLREITTCHWKALGQCLSNSNELKAEQRICFKSRGILIDRKKTNSMSPWHYTSNNEKIMVGSHSKNITKAYNSKPPFAVRAIFRALLDFVSGKIKGLTQTPNFSLKSFTLI